MKRTDNLSENALQQMVQQLADDTTELKTAQRTSGQSGILAYISQSALQWDLTNSVGSDTDTSSRSTTITAVFTGDGSQVVTMATLSLLIYVNGTDVAHQLSPAVPSWTDGTRSASIQYVTLTIGLNTYTQLIQLTTTKLVTYYVKVLAAASSRGTVTAS